MSSENNCSCSGWGFCVRRNAIVPEVHWRRCQDGKVATLDRLYAKSDVEPPKQQFTRPAISSIGSALSLIISRETGEQIHCDTCKQEIARLDLMAADDVRNQKDHIIKGIMDRGGALLGWWNPKRWAVNLAPSFVQARVSRWIDEAIEQSASQFQSNHAPLELATQVKLKLPIVTSQPRGDHLRDAQTEKLDAESRMLAGISTTISRAKLLELRAKLRAEGIDLPKLQVPPTFAARKLPRFPDGKGRNPGHWANAFTQTCIHLGKEIDNVGCGCGSSSQLRVFACNLAEGPDECVIKLSELRKLNSAGRREKLGCCEICEHYNALPKFITNQQYAVDIRALIPKIPPDVTRIVGVARSGLAAATMLSMLLHVPLDIVRQEQCDIISAGNGWRLSEGRPATEGTILVVDDTCMTGNSLKAIRPVVSRGYKGQNVLYACVYVNPLSLAKPDFWAVDLPWPHLLEWNLFNSVLLPACVFDFDGVLCEDCPPGDDEDGMRYSQFLEQALPRYPVRKRAIPMIVTARLERYRPQTLTWMSKWGVRTDELIMGPWKSISERHRSDVAEFKSAHFKRFIARNPQPGPALFIESEPSLAARIAKLSGGVVVCPSNGRCYRG